MEPAVKQSPRVASAFLIFAFCCSLFAFCPSPALADIQQPPKAQTRGERQLERHTVPPPTPVAVKVRLQPGGRADIVLQATGALGKTIDFLLRTPPAHGAFAGPARRIGRDSVSVTYVHRAADGPGRDLFTFAAQAPGTAVSAAETVQIDVEDAVPDAAPDAAATAVPAGAPDLAATPVELDFGAVEIGSTTGATLSLENRGGGLATGRLDPPAPWVVDGDGSYRLTRDARQTFRLVFRPVAQGAFAETLHVDADGAPSTAGCVVRLIGTGLPAPASAATVKPPPAATPRLADAAVSLAPPPPPDQARPNRTVPGTADSAPVVVNEARVTDVKVLAVGSTTIELAWNPPVPLPAAYRIERRYFVYDEKLPEQVRIDWRPYERADFKVRADRVTATLRGLGAYEPVGVRVVTVDRDGQLSQPSPIVRVIMPPAATWWHPTTLKVLGLLLVVCLGLLARKRWKARLLAREEAAAAAAAQPAVEPPLFTPR